VTTNLPFFLENICLDHPSFFLPHSRLMNRLPPLFFLESGTRPLWHGTNNAFFLLVGGPCSYAGGFCGRFFFFPWYSEWSGLFTSLTDLSYGFSLFPFPCEQRTLSTPFFPFLHTRDLFAPFLLDSSTDMLRSPPLWENQTCVNRYPAPPLFLETEKWRIFPSPWLLYFPPFFTLPSHYESLPRAFFFSY